MKSSLRLVWKEAIEEQASIAESKTHEQSEHPSEEWITNKEAAQLYRTIRNASDRTARTAITDARISGKIKGKKKNSGHGYLVEKGSVMNFLDKLKEADSDKHDDFTVWDD